MYTILLGSTIIFWVYSVGGLIVYWMRERRNRKPLPIRQRWASTGLATTNSKAHYIGGPKP